MTHQTQPLMSHVARLAADIREQNGSLQVSDVTFQEHRRLISTLSSDAANTYAIHVLALAAKVARVGHEMTPNLLAQLIMLANSAVRVSAAKSA